MFHDHPKFRAALYVVALVSQVVAFFVNIYDQELGNAFQLTANFLGAGAGITALTNISPERRDDGHFQQ
jgi:hypothetical protein